MSETKNKALLGVLILIIVFFLILMIFSFYTINIFKGESDVGLNFSNSTDKIAVVEISGVIMDSKDTIEKLEMARKNKDIKAIIVRVDSPGGAVGPSQEIYQEMIHIDSDKEKGKPVYASFGSIAASGGYYVGSAARKIYSNPGTLTGSIGVIMQFVDLSKLYEWAKINPNTLKAGRYKDIGSPNRDMTEEERDLMNGMLGKVHQQFIQHILDKRKDKIKGKIQDHAQGQIFSGQEAFELGLVDELAGLWQAARSIHKELTLQGEPELIYVKKKKKFSFLEMVEDLEGKFSALKNGIIGNVIPMFMLGRI